MYRTQCAVRLEGKLDREVFQKALQHVINRHGILRTIFHVLPGMEMPMQVVATHTEMCCPTISLEDLGEAEQAAQLAERFRAMQEEPFDLVQGPLCRAELVRLSVYKHILLLNLPALCADASALKHFIADLSQAYDLQGETLAEEPLQYADVSAWQDELLQEEDAELHREYWRKIDLSGLSLFRLPFERGDKGTCCGLEVKARGGFASQQCEIPVEETFQGQVEALTQR